MLRFPIEAIWPDADRRPPPLHGEVVPSSAEKESPGSAKVKAGSDVAQADDAALKGNGLPAAESIDDPSVSTAQVSLSDRCDSRDVTQPASSQDGAWIDWRQTVNDFARWLAEGVTKKRLTLNSDERTGDLWTVEEGLFIRTPGVIRDFATERGIADYVGLRRALERQNALLMNSRPSPTTKIYYELAGHVKPLKGNVIINPESMLGISLPPPSAHLRRARGRDGYY
ncbi:MAG: DNA-binding domain-containing protein [Alphaproteobacteria bacterium]|nr:DNA-binding domain-containing protein [Alphaproteobacteria bacterium]